MHKYVDVCMFFLHKVHIKTDRPMLHESNIGRSYRSAFRLYFFAVCVFSVLFSFFVSSG